jgi:hypothetical protein
MRLALWRSLATAILLAAASLAALAAGRHGGEVVHSRLYDFEYVIGQRSVSVYVEKAGQPFDVRRFEGTLWWRERTRLVNLKFVAVGQNHLRVSRIEPPLLPGEGIHIHIQPEYGPSEHRDIEIPGERPANVILPRPPLAKKPIRVQPPPEAMLPQATPARKPATVDGIAPERPPRAVTPPPLAGVGNDTAPRRELPSNPWPLLILLPLLLLDLLTGRILPGVRAWRLAVAAGRPEPNEHAADHAASGPAARGREADVGANAFAVLDIAPSATRAEVERAAQRWLALLQIGSQEARGYKTPLGAGERDADAIRQALAELRDPALRVQQELWAVPPPAADSGSSAPPAAQTLLDACLGGWPRGRIHAAPDRTPWPLRTLLLAAATGVAMIFSGYLFIALWLLMICFAVWLPCILFPTLIFERLLLPLGLPRLSYNFTAHRVQIGGSRWQYVAEGVLNAALVLLRHGGSQATLDWLHERMETVPALSEKALLASALLAALRGDQQLARFLLETAIDGERPKPSRRARRIAVDWLQIDAARARDWSRVIRFGQRGWSSLRRSLTIACLTERLLARAEARPDWQLRLLWLLAPQRRRLAPLLRAALATPPVQPPAVPQDVRRSTDVHGAVANFLGQLDALDWKHTANPDQLGPLLQAVLQLDQQLAAPATASAIEQRLRALAAPAGIVADSVLHGLRRRLRLLLTPVVAAWPQAAAAAAAPSLRLLVEEQSRQMFAEIATHCSDFANRTRELRMIEVEAEVAAWTGLRTQAEQLLRLDPSAEETLCSSVLVPLSNFAAFQFNQRLERSAGQNDALCRGLLAETIFSWLAEHTGSQPEEQAHLRDNLRIIRSTSG